MADEIKEFTSSKKPIVFTVDGEKFECVTAPPATAVIDLVDASGKGEAEAVRSIIAFLDTVLTDESSKRVAERMRSRDNAIEFPTLVDIFQYLTERIGSNRPTGGSNGSPTGVPETGAPSTAGALPRG